MDRAFAVRSGTGRASLREGSTNGGVVGRSASRCSAGWSVSGWRVSGRSSTGPESPRRASAFGKETSSYGVRSDVVTRGFVATWAAFGPPPIRGRRGSMSSATRSHSCPIASSSIRSATAGSIGRGLPADGEGVADRDSVIPAATVHELSVMSLRLPYPRRSMTFGVVPSRFASPAASCAVSCVFLPCGPQRASSRASRATSSSSQSSRRSARSARLGSRPTLPSGAWALLSPFSIPPAASEAFTSNISIPFLRSSPSTGFAHHAVRRPPPDARTTFTLSRDRHHIMRSPSHPRSFLLRSPRWCPSPLAAVRRPYR